MKYTLDRRGVPKPLDESLLTMLEWVINPIEDDNTMFNPLIIGRNVFTVEYIKADGSTGKLTGTLWSPDYKGTDNEMLAHCIDLLEKDIVPVWTDKGWRSFYQSKVVSFKFGRDES
jgi:hypothetical protein